MKKVIFLTSTIALLLTLSGCIVLSIHPYYTEGDIINESRLIGTWQEAEDSEENWVFEQINEDSYQLIISNNNTTDEYEVRLITFGDKTFLDALPSDLPNEYEYYETHSIRAHSLHWIDITNDVLRLRLMDYVWLKDNLIEGKLTLKHEMVDDQLILTASTKDLQAFVLEHFDSIFEKEAGELHRIK